MHFTDYDSVPYPGRAYPQTHPDHLATIATLFGLRPAPVGTCRILELGCGDAANLLPIAYTLPATSIAGIDLASIPIARGKADAAALRLTNIRLDVGDLCQLSAELGEFDYIIAHGLYSWVPSPVRDRLLSIIRRHLAPHGVAFVSYHVYPGFYARRMLREMLLFRLERHSSPEDRLHEAAIFMALLAKAMSARENGTTALFERAVGRLEDADAAVFLHDDLAPVNDAVYFHEFVHHASLHKLQFVAEADLFEMLDDLAPEELKPELQDLTVAGDLIRREQLLDFIKGRQFRQTLLCRAECELDRSSTPERVRTLWASASLRREDGAERQSMRLVSPRGTSVSTADPLAQAALSILSDRYPERVQFCELLQEAGLQTGDSPREEDAEPAEHLAYLLHRCCLGGVVSLHTMPAPLVRLAGARPEVSPVARLQSQRDDYVTSLVHATVRIDDPIVRQLLPLLDGTRDRAALAREYGALLDTARISTPADSQRTPIAMLEECLAKLGKSALLVA